MRSKSLNSLHPFLLDSPCNALTQSYKAFMIFLEWVMIVLVMRLCLNWIMSVSLSLFVRLM